VTGWISQLYGTQKPGAGRGYKHHAVNDEYAAAPADEERLDCSTSLSLSSKRDELKRNEDDDDQRNEKGRKTCGGPSSRLQEENRDFHVAFRGVSLPSDTIPSVH
jgi:hypothetical protein